MHSLDRVTSASADPEIDTVLRRERQLLDPAVRRSRTAASALLDPEFREFGSSGTIWDLESVLTMMSGSDDPPPEVDGIAATRLAADLIHLTYRARRTGRTSLRSSLWRRRQGEWTLYFHQGTVCPGPG